MLSETAPRKRGPAEEPGTLEERARDSRDRLPEALKKVAKTPPVVRPRSSTVASVLESKRDEIIRLLALGYSPNSLARALKDEGGLRFSIEAMRIAIKRLSDAKPPAQPTRSRASKNAATTTETPAAASTQFDPTAQYKRKPKEEQW